LETMRQYNRQLAAGTERKIPSAMQQRPLQTPPFIAVAVQAAITFTMGGLRVDDQMRVLARSASTTTMRPPPPERAYMETGETGVTIGSDYCEQVIGGLFAAGCDVGNISHFGYVGGLAPALVTGMIAGRAAAAGS